MTSVWVLMIVPAAAIVAGLMFGRRVSRKQDALFTTSKADGAVLREKCQLRVGFVDCPGVALVVGDTLVLRGVIKERRLPLSQIRLKKETAGIGKFYWWGKRLFHLEGPGISEP